MCTLRVHDRARVGTLNTSVHLKRCLSKMQVFTLSTVNRSPFCYGPTPFRAETRLLAPIAEAWLMRTKPAILKFKGHPHPHNIIVRA